MLASTSRRQVTVPADAHYVAVLRDRGEMAIVRYVSPLPAQPTDGPRGRSTRRRDPVAAGRDIVWSDAEGARVLADVVLTHHLGRSPTVHEIDGFIDYFGPELGNARKIVITLKMLNRLRLGPLQRRSRYQTADSLGT